MDPRPLTRYLLILDLGREVTAKRDLDDVHATTFLPGRRRSMDDRLSAVTPYR